MITLNEIESILTLCWGDMDPYHILHNDVHDKKLDKGRLCSNMYHHCNMVLLNKNLNNKCACWSIQLGLHHAKTHTYTHTHTHIYPAFDCSWENRLLKHYKYSWLRNRKTAAHLERWLGHRSCGWCVLYNNFSWIYNSPWLFVGIELSFLGPVMSSLYNDIQG